MNPHDSAQFRLRNRPESLQRRRGRLRMLENCVQWDKDFELLRLHLRDSARFRRCGADCVKLEHQTALFDPILDDSFKMLSENGLQLFPPPPLITSTSGGWFRRRWQRSSGDSVASAPTAPNESAGDDAPLKNARGGSRCSSSSCSVVNEVEEWQRRRRRRGEGEEAAPTDIFNGLFPLIQTVNTRFKPSN